MALENILSISFDPETSERIDKLSKQLELHHSNEYQSLVRQLVSACHALRISAEGWARIGIRGEWKHEIAYVQVNAEFFRTMLDVLKELDEFVKETDDE